MSEEIEEQLRAIEALVSEARTSGNRPMYMQARAFEAIGQHAGALRQMISAPLSDLAAFHRVADIVALRMANVQAVNFLRSEIEIHVRSAVLAASEEQRREQRLMLAVDGFLAGGPIAPVVEMLKSSTRGVPEHRAYGSYGGWSGGSWYTGTSPFAKHALRLRLSQFVPTEALEGLVFAVSEHLRTTYTAPVYDQEPSPDSPVWNPLWSMGEVPVTLRVSKDTVFVADVPGDVSRKAFEDQFKQGKEETTPFLVRPVFESKPSSWTVQVGFQAVFGLWVASPLCTEVDPAPVPGPIVTEPVDEHAPLWDPSWQPGGIPDDLVVSYEAVEVNGKSHRHQIEEVYPGNVRRSEFLGWFKDYPKVPEVRDDGPDTEQWFFTIRPKFGGVFVSRSTSAIVSRKIGEEGFSLHVAPVR